MNESELIGILHSDMKLWEKAVTSAHEKGIAKTLELPYGIGETTVVFPEDNLGAVQTYGGMVRGWVKEARGEEALEAKRLERLAAEAQAEGTVEDAGSAAGTELGDGPGDDQVVAEEAVPPSTKIISQAEAMASAADDLRRGIAEREHDVRIMRRELKALEAALEVFNAPEDD